MMFENVVFTPIQMCTIEELTNEFKTNCRSQVQFVLRVRNKTSDVLETKGITAHDTRHTCISHQVRKQLITHMHE
jgi:hypothetical protein